MCVVLFDPFHEVDDLSESGSQSLLGFGMVFPDQGHRALEHPRQHIPEGIQVLSVVVGEIQIRREELVEIALSFDSSSIDGDSTGVLLGESGVSPPREERLRIYDHRAISGGGQVRAANDHIVAELGRALCAMEETSVEPAFRDLERREIHVAEIASGERAPHGSPQAAATRLSRDDRVSKAAIFESAAFEGSVHEGRVEITSFDTRVRDQNSGRVHVPEIAADQLGVLERRQRKTRPLERAPDDCRFRKLREVKVDLR